MPIYEYQCGACSRRFERRQSFSDDPVSVCPHCGAVDVRRLLSPPAGIFFKGPGFYSTDYRQGGQRSSRNGDSEEKTPAESKETPAPTSTPAPTPASDDD